MIDLIVCHPKDLLYPRWIAQMNRIRNLFNHLVIVMTQKAEERDYTDWIAKNMKKVRIIREYPDNGKDWRNAALTKGITYLNSDFVLFLEQDMIVNDDFYSNLIEKGINYDAVGFENGERFHPACLLVRKSILDSTSKDFSVDKDIGDHFVKFSREIKIMTTLWTTLDKLGFNWKHLSGLSQNYRLKNNFHHPKEFYDYLRESLEYNQPLEWRLFTVRKIKEVEKWI